MNLFRMISCVFLLALAACAPLQPSGSTTGEEKTANIQARWNAFLSLHGRQGPSLSEGSLRFGESGNTHRVTWLLWGNDAEQLRFDIQAGIGNTLAKARLAEGVLLLYLPSDNSMLRGDDTPDGMLRRIGLDLPLSLHELYAVIQGDFSSAFSHTRILSSRTLEDDGIELELGALSPHMPAATLTLDRRNLPVRLRIPHMWDIRIDCGDDLLPRRMDGMKRNNTNGEEYRFILLIKDRQGRKQFADKELELQMPADVRLLSDI